MPTQLLSNGPTYVLNANQIYALPTVKSTLFCDTATPTIQVSNSPTFATNVPLVFVAGQAVVAGGFIQSITNPSTVTLARD